MEPAKTAHAPEGRLGEFGEAAGRPRDRDHVSDTCRERSRYSARPSNIHANGGDRVAKGGGIAVGGKGRFCLCPFPGWRRCFSECAWKFKCFPCPFPGVNLGNFVFVVWLIFAMDVHICFMYWIWFFFLILIRFCIIYSTSKSLISFLFNCIIKNLF